MVVVLDANRARLLRTWHGAKQVLYSIAVALFRDRLDFVRGIIDGEGRFVRTLTTAGRR